MFRGFQKINEKCSATKKQLFYRTIKPFPTILVKATNQMLNINKHIMKRILFLTGFLFFAALFAVNAQRTPGTNARQATQQGRIAEGVQSGEISRPEEAKLRAQQRHINRSKKQAKADGVVTPAERGQINRKQNRASRNIAVEKKD